uniref:Protein LURP-one-related 8 n=1 Tax=Anthurium amnicola TaxID=1678845 RepID=A0A1D1YT75_9ARAE
MAKVHPNAPSSEPTSPPAPSPDAGGGEAAVLTVWRKSLLFNCSGFTVFDAKGNLVFRVDNYVSGNKREVLLMDAAGKPLLTIRRKRLSLGEHWMVYQGEEARNPRFSAKKRGGFRQHKALAHVAACGGDGHRALEVEGSYSSRCCAVYDERRRPMAEVKRKEAVRGVGFGVDVFRLVVQPGFDPAVAMVIVILLDQMFGST